jgi:hypothetical protein
MEVEQPKVIKIKRNPKSGYFGLYAYPKSTYVITCQLNSKGHYNTGLTENEERYYEEKLGLKAGELSKHSNWWNEVFNSSPQYTIRLNSTKTTELFLDNVTNELKYKVILAHSDVANSELERNKPNVIFFIDDEEAKAKAGLQSLNFELEGMKKILSLTPEEVKGTLKMFNKFSTELMTTDVAQLQLMEEMKKNPKQFFDIITDKELKTKIFIYELLEKKLLTRKGNSIKYGDDTIASSINEGVEYFNDIKNQTERLTLETKLKKLKK